MYGVAPTQPHRAQRASVRSFCFYPRFYCSFAHGNFQIYTAGCTLSLCTVCRLSHRAHALRQHLVCVTACALDLVGLIENVEATTSRGSTFCLIIYAKSRLYTPLRVSVRAGAGGLISGLNVIKFDTHFESCIEYVGICRAAAHIVRSTSSPQIWSMRDWHGYV